MRKRILINLIIFSLIFSLILPQSIIFADAPSSGGHDYSGHWAEGTIDRWLDKEIIKGFTDGSFKPNQPISRADFAIIMSRIFGLQPASGLAFNDVALGAYYYEDVQKVTAAGFMNGYSDGAFRPQASISRQEAAVVIARAFELSSASSNIADVKDWDKLAVWSRAAVAALLEGAFMQGYPDGEFKGERKVTRAEALTMITIAAGELYSKPGVYEGGQLNNAVINQSGVILKNAVINGNLYLTEGIGDGEVVLDNVTVKGEVRAYGGGENSVVMNGSTISRLIVDKKNGKIRIVAAEGTVIHEALLRSGAKLEAESLLSGEGFLTVILDRLLKPGSFVVLSGRFNGVEVDAEQLSNLRLAKGSITSLALLNKVLLHLEAGTSVDFVDVIVNGEIQISGSGIVKGSKLHGESSKLIFGGAATGGGANPTSAPTSTTPTPTPTPTTDPTAAPKPLFTNVSVHDPSVIKSDGTYYVFGSHLAAAKSENLMNWTLVDAGVTADNKLFKSDISDVLQELEEALDWAETETLWAADVIQLADGKFYMYYNACRGDSPQSAMGVAVADNIEGPYVNIDIFLKSSATNYDSTMLPNAVDPDAFFDKEGNLWLVYGSYSGGIFILQLDPSTGLPLEGQGYGKKLTGSNHSRIEAPYIQYVPETDYYYLFVTYGGLAADGGYNIRVSRSENPDGPYVDYEGQNMINAHGPAGSFFDDEAIAPYGVKQFGNFIFSNLNGVAQFPVYGYVSPGHNSTYYDEQSGKLFNFFHTRFPYRGEAHEVRVHQMFINEEGWLVTAPHRYAGETIGAVLESDIPGAYHFINHGKQITNAITPSVYIELLADGTITGSVAGTWSLTDDYFAELIVDGVTYKGVFLRQWDSVSDAEVMTFSALSNEGIAIWGSQLEMLTDGELVNNTIARLTLGNTNRIFNDIELPLVGAGNAAIAWASSDASVVGADGTVTRPAAGDGNATVVLTATVTRGTTTAQKQFTIKVVQLSLNPLDDGLVARYDFDNNLNDITNLWSSGTVTGDRIFNTGGTIDYVNGISGDAAIKLDGASGVRLPDGLIEGDSYTVTMWLNPTVAANVSPAFFGAQAVDSWISFMPRGHDFSNNNTMLWSGEAWFDGSTGMKIAEGEWSHVAFTVNKGTVSIYVNGELKFTNTAFPDVFHSSDSVFALGVNYWDAPYNGLIDELRIYDIALTDTLVEKLYAGEPDPNQQVSGIRLNVADKKLAVGTSFSAKAEVMPINAGNKALSWFSSDDAIASVDPLTGEVTGIAAGSAAITAIAADGSGVTASYTVHVMDGLVAHYSFDNHLEEADGKFADAVTVGNRINAAGGQITFANGVNGDAAYFDGGSGLLLPAGLIDSRVYSVSMWLKPEEATQFATTFFGAQNTNSWISLVPRGPGAADTMLWSGTDWYDATTGMKIGTKVWTHVVFTVDYGTVKIYINGVERFSGSSFPNVFTSQNAVFALGVNYWDVPYKGLIDELKVYNRVLSEAEITEENVNGGGPV